LLSTYVSELRAAYIIRAMSKSLIALIMEAARTSGTSVDIQLRTRQYIPEDSELHTRRRENLKTHRTGFILLECIFRIDNCDVLAYLF
jgi:hypothetical protein